MYWFCFLLYGIRNPHRLGLIKDLENVQMRATKLVISIKNLTYKDSLKRLKLPTLKYRRIRGDMLKCTRSWLINMRFLVILSCCFSIGTNSLIIWVNLYIEKQQDSITRNHSLKLVYNRYHYDLRKFSFAPRIVNVRIEQLARNSWHFQKKTR